MWSSAKITSRLQPRTYASITPIVDACCKLGVRSQTQYKVIKFTSNIKLKDTWLSKGTVKIFQGK